MSIEYCDKGILDKFQAIFPNSKFNYNEARRKDQILDKEAEIRYPIIVISRTSNSLDRERYNDPAARRGYFVEEKKLRLKSVPLNITYQIDIMSDKRVEVDAIWEEVLFFLLEDPEVAVNYPGLGIDYKFPLLIEDSESVTDVESFDNEGRVYRATLTVTLSDAFILLGVHRDIIGKIDIHFDLM